MSAEQDLDLADWLVGPDPDFDAEVAPPADADEADRRLRLLAKVRREIAEVERHAADEIDRVNAWAESRYSVLHGRAQWLTDGLEMWHRAVLSEDPSRKSISLPCGTLKSRAQQPEWAFDDEVFLPWAEVHAPELVKVQVRSSVDRNAAKHAIVVLDDGRHIVSGTGEVVPGVTVTVRGPSFSVVTEEVDR